jgi:hypothetical protein
MSGFDALIPENWYNVTIENNLAEVGEHSNNIVVDYSLIQLKALLWYYSGKLENALLHLFPEIGLEEQKFKGNLFVKVYRPNWLKSLVLARRKKQSKIF